MALIKLKNAIYNKVNYVACTSVGYVSANKYALINSLLCLSINICEVKL